MNFRRQQGMTMLGTLILIAFLGLFFFAGIRLVPIYLENMKIQAVLEGVEKEFDGKNPSLGDIRVYIEKRFNVESVTIIKARDVAVARKNDMVEVAAIYSNKTPFVANVSFSVDFDERVTVRR